jgi:two-component system sensor histidine kinase/response regulator
MTDMVDLINNKIELLNFQALNKNIRIEFGNKPDTLLLELDPDLMNVVIQNLLTNAIKFTPAGGKIEVNCKIDQIHLITSIRDNGIGMSGEDAEKLFNPNIHFSTSGTGNEKGIGLGMLICKDFMDIHHGEIWVESELGKGSAFFIKLPLKQT